MVLKPISKFESKHLGAKTFSMTDLNFRIFPLEIDVHMILNLAESHNVEFVLGGPVMRYPILHEFDRNRSQPSMLKSCAWVVGYLKGSPSNINNMLEYWGRYEKQQNELDGEE